MKLEQILPEIRKGRRFKLAHNKDWSSYPASIHLDNLDSHEWELEPEKIPLSERGMTAEFMPLSKQFHVQLLGGGLYLDVAEIDALHATSLKARGIEEKPRWEQDPKYPVPVCIHCRMGLQAHPGPGSFCPNGILQDTSQYTGVDPFWRECKEPDALKLADWLNITEDGREEDALIYAYRSGWNAYYKTLKEEV